MCVFPDVLDSWPLLKIHDPLPWKFPYCWPLLICFVFNCILNSADFEITWWNNYFHLAMFFEWYIFLSKLSDWLVWHMGIRRIWSWFGINHTSRRRLSSSTFALWWRWQWLGDNTSEWDPGCAFLPIEWKLWDWNELDDLLQNKPRWQLNISWFMTRP